MTSILIIANVKRTSSSSSSSSSSGTVLTKLSRSKWMLASRVNSEWMAASLLGDNCSATTSVSSKRLLRWESRLWFWGGRAWRGEFKLRGRSELNQIKLKKVYFQNSKFPSGGKVWIVQLLQQCIVPIEGGQWAARVGIKLWLGGVCHSAILTLPMLIVWLCVSLNIPYSAHDDCDIFGWVAMMRCCDRDSRQRLWNCEIVKLWK